MAHVRDDFLSLDEDTVMAVTGPSQRYLALIEGALDVLIEMPGGGLIISGDPRARHRSRDVITALADLHSKGVTLSETDVRRLIDSPSVPPRVSHHNPSSLPQGGGGVVISGRRGAIVARTEGQATYTQALENHDLVFALGPAGSGKTFLAVASGVAHLVRGRVDRLVITRPAVEAGERLGFLPGDLLEKVDPYLTPIWGALDDILGADALRRRREKGEIEVAPLAYMRGRTLNNAYVIMDEAQNTTRLQMKMFLTRLGEGSKMVVTGDPTQVDLPNRSDSGLMHAVRLLKEERGISVAELTAKDIVRHELVARIVRAYDAEDKT